jgi:cytoskeletal protein CcmA (bactofilin family)
VGEKPGPTILAQPAISVEHRLIHCFRCGTELQVSSAAESTMCKRCSSHIDLRDYTIANAVSKNFVTKGRLVVQEAGYLFNSDSMAREVILKGRFVGKISAEERLEIYSTASIKGTIAGQCLVVPASEHIHWVDILRFRGAEIAGELVGRLQTEGTTFLRSTARFFGELRAGHLIVEAGAVFVGSAWVGAAGSME